MAKKFVRVDDRLIHGQTIIAWCPTLNVRQIIAVDDEVAANPMLKSIMEMGIPAGYTAKVVSTADAKAVLEGDSADNQLIIVRTPEALAALGDSVNGVEEIVLGNLAKRDGAVHKLGGGTGIFYLSDPDVAALDAIAEQAVPISFQQVPSSTKTTWDSFKKTIGS